MLVSGWVATVCDPQPHQSWKAWKGCWVGSWVMTSPPAGQLFPALVGSAIACGHLSGRGPSSSLLSPPPIFSGDHCSCWLGKQLCNLSQQPSSPRRELEGCWRGRILVFRGGVTSSRKGAPSPCTPVAMGWSASISLSLLRTSATRGSCVFKANLV